MRIRWQYIQRRYFKMDRNSIILPELYDFDRSQFCCLFKKITEKSISELDLHNGIIKEFETNFYSSLYLNTAASSERENPGALNKRR